MAKNEKRTLAVLAIIFVAFSVIVFAIPWAKDGIFWLSYIFAVIAIAAQVYVLKTAFKDGVDESVRSKFYGFPIAQVGVIYGAVQLLASLIFMIINASWVNGVGKGVPAWIAIIVYVLIFAAAAIGFISTDAMRDEIERQDVKLAADTTCMQSLKSIIYPLSGQVEDNESSKLLQNLAEEFKYSDPVSSESIKDIELELAALVDELQKAVVDVDVEAIKVFCQKIKVTLTERNRLCKLNKEK